MLVDINPNPKYIYKYYYIAVLLILKEVSKVV